MAKTQWRQPAWLKSWWTRSVIFIALWITAFSIDYDTRYETRLSEHLSIVEGVHVERHSFAAMAENFHMFFLPIPISLDHPLDRRLVRDGVTVWRGSAKGAGNRLAASPDGRLVLIWQPYDSLSFPGWPPWQILDVTTGRVDSIVMPPRRAERGEMVYHDLRGWSADSRQVNAITVWYDRGPDTNETRRGDSIGGPFRYRVLWTVDVADRRARITQRCELRSRAESWASTPCAGKGVLDDEYGYGW